uniref:ATP synthase complex subunit 8 n=1 Tax=Lobotes surinamensis TaxID=463596 RepID=A0A0B6VI35_9TELE|nr:ATPase subunit 8 [Lobotes surinamensis]BAQ20842.1 ATPase subunit 8 [Lobotes surinamensis]
MPQLNPTPWLLTFIFSWVTFLTILTAKVLAHQFPTEPSLQNKKTLDLESWTWPWH